MSVAALAYEERENSMGLKKAVSLFYIGLFEGPK
jgi:hypothetical protein